MGELPERLGWDEWIRWLAWWELEPWGEARADLRQAVALSYTLAPYLRRDTELPALTWPYWDQDGEELDVEALRALAAAEAKRWAEWDATRRRGVSRETGAVIGDR